MRVLSFRYIALFAAAALAPAASIINFDDLTASTGTTVVPFIGRTVPANYSTLATFTVGNGGGLYVYADASSWQGPPSASLPNVVCPTVAASASSAICTEDLWVSFSSAVNALSFFAAAWDDVNSVVRVQVFTGNNQNTPAATIQVTSPQRLSNTGLINVSALSNVANITGIRIFTPSLVSQPAGDRYGLVYDNFTFDLPVPPTVPPVPPVVPSPEPSTTVLLLGGAALLAWRRAAR